ncbi:polysaccharide lyase 8 family protein [Streptomyces sp. NPDC003717]|uniref:polysaccharide lyase 8 family protein n=1 Tax=Streptomyces sp. NPDC003717 TaxID=3154276 RepID=UPI0033AD60F5
MPTSFSRRGLLLASSGAALSLGLLPGPATAAPAVDGDEFDTLRARWRTLLLGEGFRPTAEPFRSKLAALGTTATGHAAAMAPADGSLWPDAVWADPDPDTDAESYAFSGAIQTSYARLYAMAEAWSQPGTGVTGDNALADRVVEGLDHLYARVYNERQARYGNWYSWQIGGPQGLLDTAVLLYDRLSADRIAAYCRAVDAFVPDSAVAQYTGTSTGANRIDLCRVLAVRGVLERRADKIALASRAIAPVFPYVTSGDGLYADGSIIQHTVVPYTGSYGAVLLDGLSKLLALLGGSTWEVTDGGKQIVFDAVEAAYAPFLHNGLCMDGVSGRAISRGLPPGDSRGQNDDQLRGHSLMASVVALGQGADAETNARWRALVKGWITRAHYRPAATDPQLSVAKLSLLGGVLDDATVRAAEQPTGSRVFPAMDRAVHRTRDWVASVSMASRRITYYENGNGENLRGWHTGSGMLYWWGDDYANDQYSDRFWPTVDPYRLPGTTASAKRLADGEGGIWGAALPDVDFAGGTGDGTYTVLGQHLEGLSSTMRAHKSWFLLDDAIVCLGSAITATDGTPVETIAENRHLGADGRSRLTVDGVVQPTATSWSATLTGPRWAHLEGHGGYLFPRRTPLKALREERTGSWHDINTATGATTPVSSRYLTLVLDHGSAPVDEEYAYVLLPGAGALRTAARSATLRQWLRHSTTRDVHGVRAPALGVTAAAFFAAGTFETLTSSAPACVLVREHRDGTAAICVSDPTRTLRELTLTWHHPVRSVTSRPGTLTSATTGPALRLTFGDLSGTGGTTQQTTVRLR